MKVLHVISGLGDGGAEGALYRLVGKTKERVEHLVISLAGEGRYGPLLRRQGIEVHFLEMRRARVGFDGARELWRAMRRFRPDVVQTWLPHADLLGGVVARVSVAAPVCWGVRSGALDPAVYPLGTRLLVRSCAVLSHIVPVIIISNSVEGINVHRRLGYADRFVLVPNGYDTEYLAPDPKARAAARTERQVPVDAFLVGMVARWHPLKDHATLLHALRLARLRGANLYCLLVGEGCTPANTQLRDQIRENGIEGYVRLCGPTDDIRGIMNALDLHVLTSVTEGFPNVVAEAMSCGTPCVATDAGDTKEIMQETGWVIPKRDPEAVANAILAAHSENRDQQAWRARQGKCRERIVDSYDVSRFACRWEAVWQDAVRRLYV